MLRKPQRILKLGDVLNGTIVKSTGGRRFLVRCGQAPFGWKVELHTKRPELIQEGANATFWVAKIAPLQSEVLVHDGDYGRLPISDAMRPRYRAVVDALLGETDLTADNLADARSMVLQIGKKQQADWLSVWKVLGEPSTTEVKALLALIDQLKTARKVAPNDVSSILAKISDQFGAILSTAKMNLTEAHSKS